MTAEEAGRPNTAVRLARRPGWGEEPPREIDRWLRISPDDTVTVFTGKVEVGQDIRTSLAQAVAEELRTPLNRIELVMGDTDRTPYDAGTFGSMTTPYMASHLRRIAAAAREELIERASRRWQAPRQEITVRNGAMIHDPTGRSLTFGEVAGGHPLVSSASDDAPAMPAADWQVGGTSPARANGPAIVTGRHRYPSDIKRPGMRYGKILRPPTLRGRLVSLDTSDAEAIPGVAVVRDGEYVGVVAPDEPTATRALAALRPTWESPTLPGEDDLLSYLKTHPAAVEPGRFDGPVCEEVGSLPRGLSAGDCILSATYTVAPIAHVPLEPRAAVAEWNEGKLTVWTGTQRPFGVREELTEAFGLHEEQVRVIVPDTGSGYGGKHSGEVAREAACLARAAGCPVRLVWTRQEEFTWAYVRPAGVIEITAAARRDGTLTAWSCDNYNSGARALTPPYAIPHGRFAFHPSDSPLRQGSYRALSATANTFARESMIDELAHALGIDPIEFRLRNIEDERLRAVVEAVAQSTGVGTAAPFLSVSSGPEMADRHRGAVPTDDSPTAAREGRQQAEVRHGIGIACGTEKGSYVATLAEVAIDGPEGKVRVVRVVQAFECGAIVNPDNLRNQIEGAIVQALGGALFEQVELAGGRIASDSLSRYRVPRFSDAPKIETILLDRADLPSAGAGETPIIGLAPAIGNAIFAATGIRLRSLPLAPHGLTG